MNSNFFVVVFTLLLKINSARGDSDEIYNTARMSSDLGWKSPPNDDEFSDVSGMFQGQMVRTIEICNKDEWDKNAEHWYRSPYIHAKSANRLHLEIDFSIWGCDNCKETFTLYTYHADYDEATPHFPQWREGLYQQIDTLAAHENFNGEHGNTNNQENKVYSISLNGKKGLYVAIQTKGPTCISILRLKLEYNYCPETVRDRTVFKRTSAGSKISSLVEVKGTCVDNAINTRGDMRYYCNADGEWTAFSGGCVCDRGYFAHSEGGTCTACPAPHKYKWATGNGTCRDCPANSHTFKTGTSTCTCDNGYFRSIDEDAHQPCTRIPSEPHAVEYTLDKNGLHINWQKPKDNGGRNDLFYSADCNICDDETYESCEKSCPADIQFYPSNNKKFEATNILISGLDQYSHYKIKISSYNGVSAISDETPKHYYLKVATSETVPSAVRNVKSSDIKARSFNLTWLAPEHHNSVVIDYEAELTAVSEDGSTSKPALYFKIEKNHSTIYGLEPETRYRVRMRARSAIGRGIYSDWKTFSTLPEEEQSNGSIGLILAVVVVVAVLAGVIIFVLYRKRSSNKRQTRKKVNSGFAEQKPLRTPRSRNLSTITYVDYRDPHKGIQEIASEIDRKLIKMERIIGQGEFGEVWKGTLSRKKKRPLDVAIKRLKKDATIVDHSNFLREACTMAQFDHPNIVQLKGVVTKQQPAMIISEYMKNGSLDKYLRENKNQLEMSVMLKMMHGIACGMKYLANMSYIHRDLAARNILVDQNMVCKVSDFGLSRTIDNDPNATYTTQGGKIAVRWTAPECIIDRTFTTASDVWSFGIVTWEITSYGEKPYWDMDNEAVQRNIVGGQRLPCPQGCPQVLHELMKSCWSADPSKRPDFSTICKILGGFLKNNSLMREAKIAKTTLTRVNERLPTPIKPTLFEPSEDSSSSSLQHLLASSKNDRSYEEENKYSHMSANEATSLEEWLDMVEKVENTNAQPQEQLNRIDKLAEITASDLERLGIVTAEHRRRLEAGMTTLQRHRSRIQASCSPTFNDEPQQSFQPPSHVQRAVHYQNSPRQSPRTFRNSPRNEHSSIVVMQNSPLLSGDSGIV